MAPSEMALAAADVEVEAEFALARVDALLETPTWSLILSRATMKFVVLQQVFAPLKGPPTKAFTGRERKKKRALTALQG